MKVSSVLACAVASVAAATSQCVTAGEDIVVAEGYTTTTVVWLATATIVMPVDATITSGDGSTVSSVKTTTTTGGSDSLSGNTTVEDAGEAPADSAVASTSTTPTSTATGQSTVLGPVANPTADSSNLKNIVPSTNVTLCYGSNDTSTPDINALVTLQMKTPAVVLEDIQYVQNVVCSDSGVEVTFNDNAGYETSLAEWPTSGDFILITNHLGNCDSEFERGLFLVGAVTFDESTLTVTATADTTDFNSTAGGMQVTFGQNAGNITAAPYSNSTGISKRDIKSDPTYSMSVSKSITPNTTVASVGSYLEVVANEASFSASATFKGYLDYNFWEFKMKQLYFDLDVSFDAELELTADIDAAYQHSFSYSPSSLTISPINIPGIVTLGPALDFAIGAYVLAEGNVTINTQGSVTLADGNAHVDLLKKANTGASGWTPTYTASAKADSDFDVQLNPYVVIGVELAVEFLGIINLSSGINANATLTNELALTTNTTASTSTGVTSPSGTVNGVCQNGLEYISNFYFGITGFVTSSYSATIYSVEVPVFDKCWSWTK